MAVKKINGYGYNIKDWMILSINLKALWHVYGLYATTGKQLARGYAKTR